MIISRVKSKKIKRILSFAAAVLLFAVSVFSFSLITGTEAYAAGAEPFPFDIYDLSKSEYLMVGTPTDDFEGIGAGMVHGRVTGDGASFRGDLKYYGSEFDPKTKEIFQSESRFCWSNFPCSMVLTIAEDSPGRAAQ